MRQAHLLEVGMTKIPGDHNTLAIVRHVGLHVEFSSTKSSLGLHLCVWNELGRSPPFRPMRALRLQWSFAFNLVCEVALTPIVIVLRGLVFHPLFCKLWISGSYLVYLCVRAWSGNLSWHYMNSMSWIVSEGEGVIGVCAQLRASIVQRMFGLDLAWQWGDRRG